MDKIKRNPTKYVKIFGAIYVVLEWLLNNYLVFSITSSFEFGLATFINSITLIFASLPFILFLVYIAKWYGKKKDHASLKIPFVILALSAFWGLYQHVNKFMVDKDANEVVLFASSILACACYLFILADVFTGLKNAKRSGICSVILCLGYFVGTLLIMISNILNGENEELILYYVGCMISYLVECVCFSIFWFVAIPFTRTTTLEMDLEELHTKYIQGAISEEDYQLQKTQILEKI